MRNALQRISAAVEFKDPANGGCLGLCNLEPYAIGFSQASITEHTAASMERFQRTALHPAVSLKSELPRVHAIDQTMNTEQNLGLRTVRVDTLGNGNQANAGKRQALIEVQRIG